MSSLFKKLDGVGKTLSREVDKASRSVDHALAGHKSSIILDNFRTNNVVQLVSRSSGRTLQIVTAPTGGLVVDGMGPEGPQFYHAHWTITNDGNNTVRLHNNNNYLAIVNGATQICNYPDPTKMGVETKFRLIQIDSFIILESFQEGGRHVGIVNTGHLKSALATGREMDAQFGVRLIYTPYAAAAPATGTAATAPKPAK